MSDKSMTELKGRTVVGKPESNTTRIYVAADGDRMTTKPSPKGAEMLRNKRGALK